MKINVSISERNSSNSIVCLLFDCLALRALYNCCDMGGSCGAYYRRRLVSDGGNLLDDPWDYSFAIRSELVIHAGLCLHTRIDVSTQYVSTAEDLISGKKE